MKTWRAKIGLGRLAWLLLIAAAGASSWLIIANRGGGGKPTTAALQRGPDYTLETAIITHYAASGTHRYILHAQRIVHQRVSGVALLTDIGLDYYPQAQPYWHMSAAHGSLSSDGNRVTLVGNVRAHQPEAAVPLHLATPKMKVQVHERLLSTDAHVKLWQGTRESEGIGLKGNLETGVVKLLHDVTSRYAH
ncbi:MAG: LPS export ABC transporter periplasmic protein LptC [Gammaproteobacteria bacterium]